MAQILHLESFDDGNIESLNSHPEYLRGLADGQATVVSQSEAEQAQRWEEICSILTETRFTYTEARQSLVSDLRAVVEVSLDSLLPAAATVGLVAILKEQIDAALTESTDAKMQITAHPDAVEQIKDVIAATHPDQISVVPSPRDGPMVAWIGTDKRETCVNLEDAMTAIKTAFECLLEPAQRNTNHG